MLSKRQFIRWSSRGFLRPCRAFLYHSYAKITTTITITTTRTRNYVHSHCAEYKKQIIHNLGSTTPVVARLTSVTLTTTKHNSNNNSNSNGNTTNNNIQTPWLQRTHGASLKQLRRVVVAREPCLHAAFFATIHFHPRRLADHLRRRRTPGSLWFHASTARAASRARGLVSPREEILLEPAGARE